MSLEGQYINVGTLYITTKETSRINVDAEFNKKEKLKSNYTKSCVSILAL